MPETLAQFAFLPERSGPRILRGLIANPGGPRRPGAAAKLSG